MPFFLCLLDPGDGGGSGGPARRGLLVIIIKNETHESGCGGYVLCGMGVWMGYMDYIDCACCVDCAPVWISWAARNAWG
jgi:hypothetical protein